MTTADSLLPQRPGGMAPGAALSLAVHGGLIAALTLGVGWRMQAPEVVSAELWSSLPQVAAPKAEQPPSPAPAPTPAPTPAPPPPKVAPPPEPTEAQIATERAERLKREEKERADAAEALKKRQQRERDREAEEKKQREEQAKAEKADKARLEKLREEQMKRLLGNLQGSGNPQSTGSDARNAAPSQAYGGRLIRMLRDNLVYNGNPTENPTAVVHITAAAGGTIVVARMTRKSGVPEYDEAVMRAVDKLGRLPADTDGRVPPEIDVTFRLRE